MRSPLQFHFPPALSGNMKVSNELPEGFEFKIPFATPKLTICDMGVFVSQSVNGDDYWIELRSFRVKQDGYTNLIVSKPCISIALFLKGNVDGELAGNVLFSMGAKTYTIFYLPAGVQQINMSKGEYIWLCIIPPAYYLKNMALEHPGMRAIVKRLLIKEAQGAFLSKLSLPYAIRRIIKRLEKTNKQGAALDFDLRRYMLEILGLYNEQYKIIKPVEASYITAKEKASAVKEYIHSNLGDVNLGGLNELALRFHTGTKPLTNEFRRLTGKTIPQYISDERMAWAKRLLDKKEMHVFEIAWIVGFTDTANFNRVFRKKFGFAPLNRKAKGK